MSEYHGAIDKAKQDLNDIKNAIEVIKKTATKDDIFSKVEVEKDKYTFYLKPKEYPLDPLLKGLSKDEINGVLLALTEINKNK